MGILTENWLLADLMPSEVSDLQRSASVENLVAGKVIIEQGRPNDTLWIVVRGKLAIQVPGADGKAQRVGELGPGDLAGEMSWLDGGSASASILAAEPTQVVRIRFADFDKFLWDRPDAHIQVLRKFAINLSHRLRSR